MICCISIYECIIYIKHSIYFLFQNDWSELVVRLLNIILFKLSKRFLWDFISI